MTDEELIKTATDAAALAYCPYSRLRVGAAVLANGQVFRGCNVENASLGLTICAERAAIFTAVAAGSKRLEAIAISCPDTPATGNACHQMPRGACRQVMMEFGNDNTRVLVAGIGEFRLDQLMKTPFRL
jgi:cytidine deaminase